jgi:periplasmic protein TonB
MRRTLMALLILSGAPRPLVAQEKVMQVTEDDLRKAAIVKIEPDYPAVARQIRLTGEVELEIGVDDSGAVDRVNVRRGNTLLTGASVQAIRKWKFNPFRAEGQPAKAVGPIKFTFQM